MLCWIMMTATCLLIPGVLMGFGSLFAANPPSTVNALFGYRTAMSMKNKDTWIFANRYWGKLARKTGFITLIVSLIAMATVILQSDDTIALVGTIVILLQLIPILGTIPVVEKALKKEFDPNGNRRTKEKGTA